MTQKQKITKVKISKTEQIVHHQLIYEEKAGVISHLQYQRKFELVVNGVEIGVFTPDFIYKDSHDRWCVKEAKGYFHERDRFRFKVFMALYADHFNKFYLQDSNKQGVFFEVELKKGQIYYFDSILADWKPWRFSDISRNKRNRGFSKQLLSKCKVKFPKVRT